MRPLLFCSLLAVSLATVAPAAPVPTHLMPKELPLFYLTKVGAKWVYDDNGLSYTYIVTKVETNNGVSRVVVALEIGEGKTQEDHTLEVSSKGLREVNGFKGLKTDPPESCLRLPHIAGEKWVWGPSTYTAEGCEEVKVPAGTFQALRVTKVSILGIGKNECRLTTWYAAGVGPVRVEWRAGSTQDLVSFTAGKD